MLYVPVVSKTGKALMPTSAYRCRKLLKAKKAIKRFNKGIFYIQLTQREDGDTQEIVLGIDPGSKKEGYTVKSKNKTFLNIQCDAITWVKGKIESRRNSRRTRRSRKTPYRKCRYNRKIGGIPPSTLARWNIKLRIVNWLSKLYPIITIIVEDIKAITKKYIKNSRWNLTFSLLQVGKNYFYKILQRIYSVFLVQGQQTKQVRDFRGLKKSKDKLANKFTSHCVDSWVMANWYFGNIQKKPENTSMLLVSPIQYKRRQLHMFQPSVGNIRKRYGGTMSLGYKKGTFVKHIKFGLGYIGGNLNNKLSLHNVSTGERITKNANISDISKFYTILPWKFKYISGSAAA